jgi:hypothetical protein
MRDFHRRPSARRLQVRAPKIFMAAATATLVLAAAPGVAGAAPKSAGTGGTAVCNEAENSFRGGYTVSGGPVDPKPPAFLRGSQMRVGAGGGTGLVNAAAHSPALRLCGPTSDSGTPVDPVDPVDPVGGGDPTTPVDGGGATTPGDGGGVVISI